MLKYTNNINYNNSKILTVSIMFYFIWTVLYMLILKKFSHVNITISDFRLEENEGRKTVSWLCGAA